MQSGTEPGRPPSLACSNGGLTAPFQVSPPSVKPVAVYLAASRVSTSTLRLQAESGPAATITKQNQMLIARD